MNTLKSVLKHFENIEQKEVELSAEKVELKSEIVNLSALSDADKIAKKAQEDYVALDKLLNNLKSSVKTAKIKADAAIKAYKEIEKKASELGIKNILSNTPNSYDRTVAIEENLKQIESKISQIK